MESVIYLLVGLVIGAVLFLKPEALKQLPTAAYAYLCFGLLLFGASLVTSWIGFTCVIVSYVLYQGSKGALSENLRYFVTLQWWPKRKTKVEKPTATDVEEPVVPEKTDAQKTTADVLAEARQQGSGEESKTNGN